MELAIRLEYTSTLRVLTSWSLRSTLWIGRGEAVADDIAVPIDPENPDVKPYLSESGRTMLPLRFIAETLAADVEWDAATEGITITLH